jgi:CheY-like chemotaxis protein
VVREHGGASERRGHRASGGAPVESGERDGEGGSACRAPPCRHRGSAGVTDDPIEAIGHLEQVLRLKPDSVQARQGIEKLKSQLPPTAWQCPVCEHTPCDGDTVADRCLRCRSVVDLANPDLFDTEMPGINRPLVEAALQRLRAKWATAPTPETTFALGLAYLNLGFGDEGMRALRSAVGGRGANPAWRDEVARLTQHREELASAQQIELAGDTQPNLPSITVTRLTDRPRVMVVDDSPTVRRMVSIALKSAGYQVIEATDADHAAKLVHETGAPKLFILDVNMPGMDGFGLCKHFRADAETANVPIIFLTGKTGLLSKIHGRWTGAAEYLTKPFQREKLLATVARLVPAS